MAISRTRIRDQLAAAVERLEDRPSDDGLSEFAVWADRDLANDRMVVRKVEPYDPTKNYPKTLSGVIRAKDELDVYRFFERYNRDRDYYE